MVIKSFRDDQCEHRCVSVFGSVMYEALNISKLSGLCTNKPRVCLRPWAFKMLESKNRLTHHPLSFLWTCVSPS